MVSDVSKEQVDAWFDSGPITEEILALWLEVINHGQISSI